MLRGSISAVFEFRGVRFRRKMAMQLYVNFLSLKDLYVKKEEMKEKELLEAVEKSSKTYEGIMAFSKTEE